MAQSSLHPAPVVPVAAALIAGAAWGVPSVPVLASATLCVSAGVAAVALRRHGPLALAAAIVSAAACGACVQAVSWNRAGARLEAAFRGAPSADRELSGGVVSAPERMLDGGRSLVVDSLSAEGLPALRVRIAVESVPGDDVRRLDGLRHGDTVTVYGRLTAPAARPGSSLIDSRRRFAAERIDANLRVKSSRLVRRLATGRAGPARLLDDARCRARDALDRAVGSRGVTRAVMGAMVLGDRLLLDDDTNALLRDAGLIHILSISGLHTSLSVLVVFALLRRARMGPAGLLVVGTLALLAFSAFVGQGASVWRACGSLAVGLVARALGRDVDALAAVALAGAALVLAFPPLVWNAGFVLSVTATAGLIAATRGTEGSFIRRSLSASGGAYLATAGLLASLFTRLAPVALLANLAAAPLCAACLVAGAASVITVSIPLLGSTAANAAHWSVEALMAVSRAAASAPGGHFRVAAPGAVLTSLYTGLLPVVLLTRSGDPRLRALRTVFAITTIALHLGPPPPGAGPAAITVFDVGQGLAVALRAPDGRFVLDDAGPAAEGRFDAGDRIVIPALAASGCRRLDALAISHDHNDHSGGARAVLRDLEVGELWLARGALHDPRTHALAAEAIARGVAVRCMTRRDVVTVGGLRLEALHPGPADSRRPLNDRCLALRARTPWGRTVLLPGDLEAPGEAALLAAIPDVRADVLIASHHGANGSNSAAFLDGVKPKLVIVSAGAGNRFGHPGDAAIARIRSRGARILRTDRDGPIVATETAASWAILFERDRHGDEGENEDQGEDDGDGGAAWPQRIGLVEQARMPVAQHDEDDQP